MRWLPLIVLCACMPTRTVELTFGSNGEGLDGFMCKDEQGAYLMEKLADDGRASLVFDFIQLGGVPGCRTGQLVSWCSTHDCSPIKNARGCVEVTLPRPVAVREDFRKALVESLAAAGVQPATGDAPDEFVLARVVGTKQSCADLLARPDGSLPSLDKAQLLGCAYSCPVLFDRVEQDVYLGFETLTAACAQGVRICSDDALTWQP